MQSIDRSGNNPPRTFLARPATGVRVLTDRFGVSTNIYTLEDGSHRYADLTPGAVEEITVATMGQVFTPGRVLYIRCPYAIACRFMDVDASPDATAIMKGKLLAANGDNLPIPENVLATDSLFVLIPDGEAATGEQATLFAFLGD